MKSGIAATAVLAFALTAQGASAQEQNTLPLLTPEEAQAQNCGIPEQMAFALPILEEQRDIYTPQYDRIVTFPDIQSLMNTWQAMAQGNEAEFMNLYDNAHVPGALFSECQALNVVTQHTMAPVLVFEPADENGKINGQLVGAESFPTPQ